MLKYPSHFLYRLQTLQTLLYKKYSRSTLFWIKKKQFSTYDTLFTVRSTTQRSSQRRRTRFTIPRAFTMVGTGANRQRVYACSVPITVARVIVAAAIPWRPHVNRAETTTPLLRWKKVTRWFVVHNNYKYWRLTNWDL